MVNAAERFKQQVERRRLAAQVRLAQQKARNQLPINQIRAQNRVNIISDSKNRIIVSTGRNRREKRVEYIFNKDGTLRQQTNLSYNQYRKKLVPDKKVNFQFGQKRFVKRYSYQKGKPLIESEDLWSGRKTEKNKRDRGTKKKVDFKKTVTNVNNVLLSGQIKSVKGNTLTTKSGKKIDITGLNASDIKKAMKEVNKTSNTKIFDSKTGELVEARDKKGKVTFSKPKPKNIDLSPSKVLLKSNKSGKLSFLDPNVKQNYSKILQENRIKDLKNTQFVIDQSKVPKTRVEKAKNFIITGLNFVVPLGRAENKDIFERTIRGESVSSREYRNMAVDTLASIPAAKLVKGAGAVASGISKVTVSGNKIRSSSKAYRKGKTVDIGVTEKKKILDRFKGVKFGRKEFEKFINDYGVTIATDVAFADATYRTAQKTYGVNNAYINKEIQRLKINKIEFKGGQKINSSQKLYNLYNTYVGEETNIIKDFVRDGKVRANPNYYLRAVGFDVSSAKGLERAQANFVTFLKQNGATQKEALELTAQLENKRRARIISQVAGGVITEFSSEYLGRNLVKQGFNKNVAVGVAGTREAMAVLGQEAFIQEGQVTTSDFVFAITLGAAGSVYFSQQELKSLKKGFGKDNKKIDKVLKKSSKGLVKTFSKAKRDNILKKYFQNYDGVTPTKARQLRSKLTKKEANKILEELSFATLKKKAGKGKLNGKETLPSRLNSYLADLIEPTEIAGDILENIRAKIMRKSKNKAELKDLRLKRAKTFVATKSFSKSSSKSKSKAKSSSKATSKSKSKTKSKSKVATKTKPKTKTKSKVSTKSKSKTKPKTKTKSKTKIKIKSKVKTKVKTAPFPIVRPKLSKVKQNKGTSMQTFNLEYKRGSKTVKKTLNFPKNKALKFGIDNNLKKFNLIPAGKRKTKDIKTPQKRNNYTIKPLKTRISVSKKP